MASRRENRVKNAKPFSQKQVDSISKSVNHNAISKVQSSIDEAQAVVDKVASREHWFDSSEWKSSWQSKMDKAQNEVEFWKNQMEFINH